MKFRIEAPNKSQLSVGCKLGSFTFEHGEILDTPIVNDLAKIFPVFFIPVEEEKVEEVIEEPKVEEAIPEVVEETQEEKVEEVNEEEVAEEVVEGSTEPKKRGRKPKAE